VLAANFAAPIPPNHLSISEKERVKTEILGGDFRGKMVKFEKVMAHVVGHRNARKLANTGVLSKANASTKRWAKSYL
jgi:hypothetical protein